MSRKGLAVLFFNLVFSFSVFAQDDETPQQDCPEPDDKEAVKLFKKGIDRKKYEKAERMKYLKEALAIDPDYAEANFAMAEELVKTADYSGSNHKVCEPFFLKVVQSCPNLHSDPYFFLAKINFDDKKWKQATEYAKKFLDFKSDDEKKFSKDYAGYLVDAEIYCKYGKFYDDMFSHPVSYNPEIVKGISTARDEYLPMLSPDNEVMLFIRVMPLTTKTVYATDKTVEIFMNSKRKKEGEFDEGWKMDDPFNENPLESSGSATLTVDNKHMYFVIGKMEGGAQYNFDIYYSDNNGGNSWTIPEKVPNLNDKERWDSQPSVSADGKTIYFASDRKGGYGGEDLYKITKGADGKWGTPVNLGPKINTNGNEKSPFIHSDSQTLYFSSGPDYKGQGGHMGLGGLDIFYSKADDSSEWQQPKNIGYPINTQGDDIGFFVSTDGHYGYFASNDQRKTLGKYVGGWDVYRFELYKEARPDDIAFIKGQVEISGDDANKDFSVTVTDAVTKKVTQAVVDTNTGSYALIVNTKTKNDLILNVKKKDYVFTSQLISVKDSVPDAKPKKLNVEMQKIEVGKTFPLNNIYFETNSAEIKKRSMIVIEEFVAYLKDNPEMQIEIHGHTDNVGNPKDNQNLSAERAYNVLDAIVKMGIDKSRIVASKGFGQSKPIASNDTEQGRSKNRRTEFLIVSK